MPSYHKAQVRSSFAPNAPALDGLRVLHVQKSHGLGGSERHIIDLCRGLAEHGLRPHILWLESPGQPIEKLTALCEQRALACARLPIRADFDPLLIWRLRRFLRAHPPDLLHLHLIHATFHGALAATRSILPLVATRHGTEPYQRRLAMRAIARIGDRCCARIIAPSRHVADNTRRWDGTPPEKLRILPHGIDPPELDWGVTRRRQRARLGITEAAFVIGSIARLHPAKDHPTLLRAFASLARQHADLHLLLLGSGPRENALRAQAAELFAGDTAQARVRFLGERADVGQFLPAMDAAVLCSRREGFGLAALETMAVGLPTVASNVGGLRELIDPEENGLLVPPGDAMALQQALSRLIVDRDLRHRLGEGARSHARQFRREEMVAGMMAIYAEVLAERGRLRTAGSGAD